MKMIPWSLNRWLSVAVVVVAALVTGCENSPTEFQLNRLYVANQQRAAGDLQLSVQQQENLRELMGGLFGTPDDPHVPSLQDLDLNQYLDVSKLRMAAGAVSRDEGGRPHGLYREHCVHCHGVSGNGRGPTAAFLNPYPRDYRMGAYKFKSTPGREPPTHDDLKRILYEGIPGTSMPSFKLLTEYERESLVEYVKYLSIRGMVERELIRKLTSEMDEGYDLNRDGRLTGDELPNDMRKPVEPSEDDAEDVPPEPSEEFDLNRDGAIDRSEFEKAKPEEDVDVAFFGQLCFKVGAEGSALADQQELIVSTVRGVVESWQNADSAATPVPQRTIARGDGSQTEYLASVDRGRQLFAGLGGCSSCHGETGLGDTRRVDHDNWTKEIAPKESQVLASYLELGALPPRPIRPRNLRMNVFRGGRRPVDLFWRIRNGIDASGMPAQAKLTDEQVWDLVNYVQQLPYEPVSEPGTEQPAFQRDRG